MIGQTLVLGATKITSIDTPQRRGGMKPGMKLFSLAGTLWRQRDQTSVIECLR